MFKYLKMIPLIFYPYAYMVVIILMFTGIDDVENFDFGLFIGIYAILVHALSLISIIINIINSLRGKYTPKQIAKINLITKCFQIPAYLVNFFLGLLGLLMSVWGIIVIVFVVVVDFLTILQTGINALGVIRVFKKKNVLDKTICTLFGFLSFIYVIDVIIAIICYIKALQFKEENTNINYDNLNYE